MHGDVHPREVGAPHGPRDGVRKKQLLDHDILYYYCVIIIILLVVLEVVGVVGVLYPLRQYTLLY